MAGTIQIGGLVSGLDTSKIIEQLIAIQQRPLKQLESQQKTLKERKAALTELATKLNALRTKSFNLLLSSTSQARTASTSDAAVATAKAAPATAIQSFSFEVVQLATRSSLTSPASIGSPVDSTGVPLDQAGFGITPTSGTFSINGTNVTVNASTDTIGDGGPNDILLRINATVPGVTATLNGSGNGIDLVSTTGPIVIGVIGNTSNFLTATKLAASSSVEAPLGTWTNSSTGGMGTAQPAESLQNARLAGNIGTATGQFTINGVAFSWNADGTDAIADDTINTIVSRINSSAAKVTASYDAATDTFSLVGKDTGPAAIAVSDDTGNLLGALGITGATQQYGKTSQYKVNGGPVQSGISNTVTDAVSGVTLTLKGIGTTTVDVAQDIATTVNGVKDWVAAYNEALTLIRQQVLVDPTTNAAAIFTGNPIIQGIEARLRQVANTADTSLGTEYTELPDIGISTGPIGATPGSTNNLVLDEAKLTQALQSDAAAVTSLLTSGSGPISSLNSYLLSTTAFTGSLNTAQQSADRQLRDIDSRTRLIQQRIDQRQIALERKFANLETVMAKLQAQSAQLAGQLGQLGSMGGK